MFITLLVCDHLGFNPTNETFKVFTLPSPEANVRQILGKAWGGLGGVWGRQIGSNYHE
ncbi:MAG: hypothetical protein ACRD8Z_13360 [Nitrososphaeraceae archaeon]